MTKLKAKEPGEAVLVVKSDDKEKQIKVNVTKSIESINIDKTDVTVRESYEEDIKVTKELKTLLESLNVNLLEHFIFCGDECVSLVKSGAIVCERTKKNTDTLKKAG